MIPDFYIVNRLVDCSQTLYQIAGQDLPFKDIDPKHKEVFRAVAGLVEKITKEKLDKFVENYNKNESKASPNTPSPSSAPS